MYFDIVRWKQIPGPSVFTDNFVYGLSILLTSFTAIPIWKNLLTE